MLACETAQNQLPGFTLAAAGFLAAGAADASFFASFTVPEVPEQVSVKVINAHMSQSKSGRYGCHDSNMDGGNAKPGRHRQ